jgi:hypothetical protein
MWNCFLLQYFQTVNLNNLHIREAGMPKSVDRLGYGLDDLALETQQGQGIFLFLERPEERWDTHSLLFNG